MARADREALLTVACLIYLQQIPLLRSLLYRRNWHNRLLVRRNKEQKISGLRWNLCWAADSTWNCQWNDLDEKWIELEMLGKHTACTGACLEFLAVISFTLSLMHPQKKSMSLFGFTKKSDLPATWSYIHRMQKKRKRRIWQGHHKRQELKLASKCFIYDLVCSWWLWVSVRLVLPLYC